MTETERDRKARETCERKGHIPKKAALDSSVWCMRCAAYLGEAH